MSTILRRPEVEAGRVLCCCANREGWRATIHGMEALRIWNKTNGGMGSFYRSKHESRSWGDKPGDEGERHEPHGRDCPTGRIRRDALDRQATQRCPTKIYAELDLGIGYTMLCLLTFVLGVASIIFSLS